MAEEFVSRLELDKLGQSMYDIKEKHIECKAKTEANLLNLNREQSEIKKDLVDIKHTMTDISDKVNKLTLKMSLAIGIIVFIINFILPILSKKLGI